MKILTTLLVSLVTLAASAQVSGKRTPDLDLDTLMGMRSVAERTVMQAYNGGACHVTPLSDLPVAVRSIFGQPVPSIFVGQTPTAAHFIASDVDKTYFSNRNIVVSVCSRLKPGSELSALRKVAQKYGLPNAAHLAWMWETLSFDQITHEETVLSRFYLDEHGMLVKALGEVFPGLPSLMVLRPGSPSFHQDIASFLESHQPRPVITASAITGNLVGTPLVRLSSK